MGEAGGHSAEWKKQDARGQTRKDSIYRRHLKSWGVLQTGSRMVVARGGGGGGGEQGVFVDWVEFQFGKMKRVLERDGGKGCTSMQVYLMPLNCTLKNG